MRLLILSSSTGGGHDMRARSLSEWCRALAPPDDAGNGIEIFRYQALEESSGLYALGVGIYNWIQKKWPALHHLYFNFLEVFQVSASEHTLLGKKKFAAFLKATQPDLIVSVHAHTNHAFRKMAQCTLPGLRFVTYCGEMHGGYGFSRHWVDPEADGFFGATEAICEAARRQGMPATRVHHAGFLLHPKFYGPALTPTARAEHIRDLLGLDPDKPLLLLATGANAAQNHRAFLAALDGAGIELQIVALCGRKHEAIAQLEGMAGQWPRLSVRALGYQEHLFTLLQCADAVVARPGTGTTSEAIQAGCPIWFNAIGGIMPQEWITVKYLRSRQLRPPLIRRPRDLVDAVKQQLLDPATLCATKDAMRGLRPEPTPQDLVTTLQGLTSTHNKQTPDPSTLA